MSIRAEKLLESVDEAAMSPKVVKAIKAWAKAEADNIKESIISDARTTELKVDDSVWDEDPEGLMEDAIDLMVVELAKALQKA